MDLTTLSGDDSAERVKRLCAKARRPLQDHLVKALGIEELHLTTGAAAVDMESHIAAAYAAEYKLPFAALRVISDPAHRTLPSLAKDAIKPNGDIDIPMILRGVARNPRALRGLVSTGIEFNRALRSLRGCRDFLLSSLLGAEGLRDKGLLETDSLVAVDA